MATALEQAQAQLVKMTAKHTPTQVEVPQEAAIVVERAVPQPEVIPPVVQKPVEDVVIAQPVVSSALEAQMQALQVKLEKIEHSYSSLQGKYNKELPDARMDSARLRAENDLLREQAVARASQAEIPAVQQTLIERLGQEKVDEIGEDYVNLVGDEVSFAVNQALEKQKLDSNKELEALKQDMEAERWRRYNSTIQSQVPNFIDLVDPYGNGQLDKEFEIYLREGYMFDAFDNADRGMNSEIVSDLCNRYNATRAQEPVPVIVEAPQPLPNPKAQAVAPNTTNNAMPQLQPQTPAFIYKMSDYIDNGNAFARREMSETQWLDFESKFEQAVAEGQVNLTA